MPAESDIAKMTSAEAESQPQAQAQAETQATGGMGKSKDSASVEVEARSNAAGPGHSVQPGPRNMSRDMSYYLATYDNSTQYGRQS